MNHIKLILLQGIIALGGLTSAAQDDAASAMPKVTTTVYGTIRARAEVSTIKDESRFQVRTGRVGVLGSIGRSVSYKAELDLCDRGATKVTDVWARFNLPAGFKIQAGQMRMPFTLGSARGPQHYLFADRPFVDKQFIGPRNVGLKGVYNCPTLPLNIEAGVFNSTSNGNHAVWQQRYAFASKASYRVGNVLIGAGFESLSPSDIRINHLNGSLTWTSGRWMAEGEYVYKHYTNGAFGDAHAYNFMADYAMPVKWGEFNRLSFQGRFDGMSDNASGSVKISDDDPRYLAMTDRARRRLTLGTTLACSYQAFKAEIKLNYENYFYSDDFRPTPDNGNKLVAEVVIKF